jgi:fatty acid desaturase
MKKLEKIIARYETPESKAQPLSNIPTENPTGLNFRCPFHEDVKKMAQEYFKEKNCSHKMKPWLFVCVIIVIILEIIACIMVLKGYRVALVAMPVLGWLLTGNVSHEASHFAMSSRPWVNEMFAYSAAPMCYNSTAWYIQHIVQHHVYTNDEDDVDLYHFLPICRTSRFSEWSASLKLQPFAVWMALPTSVVHLLFVVPLDLLTGYIDPVTQTRRYEQCDNVDDLVAGTRKSLLLEFCLCFVFPFLIIYNHGFVKGFTWIAILYSLASACFILFTQGAHLQEECMVSKDEAQDKSWAIRQVQCSLTFSADSQFWSLASGALNMQALHHILPTVSASHLTEMYPKFKEVCKKHNVEVKECSGMIAFFGGFLGWIKTLSRHDPVLDKAASLKAK